MLKPNEKPTARAKSAGTDSVDGAGEALKDLAQFPCLPASFGEKERERGRPDKSPRNSGKLREAARTYAEAALVEVFEGMLSSPEQLERPIEMQTLAAEFGDVVLDAPNTCPELLSHSPVPKTMPGARRPSIDEAYATKDGSPSATNGAALRVPAEAEPMPDRADASLSKCGAGRGRGWRQHPTPKGGSIGGSVRGWLPHRKSDCSPK